jgi:hypothetical protein
VVERELPDDVESMISSPNPIRICLCETSPAPRFVALGLLEWRRVLSSGKPPSRLDLHGVCNEVACILEFTIEVQNVGAHDFDEVIKLRIKGEALEAIESANTFSNHLRVWWTDVQRLARRQPPALTSRELGSGELFNSITPFSIRGLKSPSECLRFCYHLRPLGIQSSAGFLPNWAVIASRSGGDREKIHIFVSLLRGFSLDAYAVVAAPRCCALSVSGKPPLFFDVAAGRMAMPPMSSVAYVYNEKVLFANLRPNAAPDWDLNNPLKWKRLEPPESRRLMRPTTLPCGRRVDERFLEFQVREIVTGERRSFGLNTKWNSEIEKMLWPIVASYELDFVRGKVAECLELHNMAVKVRLRPMHSLKAAPAMAHGDDACDIFRALMDTKFGLDILGVRETAAEFALVVKRCEFPEGVCCTWAIFAVESMMPFT